MWRTPSHQPWIPPWKDPLAAVGQRLFASPLLHLRDSKRTTEGSQD